MGLRYFWRGVNWNSRLNSALTRVPYCRWLRPWHKPPGPVIHWMRDPTRGGVATALNELARDCGLAVFLSEEFIPVRDTVRGACELLGLDPLHIANEGQFLAVVSADCADAALAVLKGTPGGQDAAILGEIRQQPAATVLVTTGFGGSRVVDMLVGDPLPRIC